MNIVTVLKGIVHFIRRYKYVRQLRSIGANSYIISPLRIDGAKNISIGKDTIIQHKAWLAAMLLTDSQSVELKIGDGCTIGHFNEIYATRSIIIEDNVLTADRVYISDNLHGYIDVDDPIKKQPIKQLKSVTIGEGSWIGIGVAVIGASIGKHCVIGANAVVTKDIPDYSVAVGIPAKVIKRYNFMSRQWEKTNPD